MKIRQYLDKYKSIPDSVKAAVAFTVSSFILRGIAFITTPIFTRLMDTTQYGILSTFNSWQTIIEVFALLGLTSAGVFNVGLNDYRDSRDQYLSSTLVLCNLATIVVFAVIFFVKGFLGEDFILPNNLLLLMFMLFLFSPAQVFWVTRQRYEYKYKLATLITILSAVVSQTTAVICVLNLRNGHAAEVKLWSSGMASMAFYLPIYIYIIYKGKTGFDKNRWKQLLIFALPLLPHYLAQHVMAGADRIMIAEMVSQAEAGIYSVVSAISLIASVIWNAINASLTPFIFEKMNKKMYGDIHKVVICLVIGYAVMCLGVTLIAPEVLAILAPEEYRYGVYAVPPIAGVSFLSALYNIYATVEFYHKKSSNIARATLVACVVNIILNAIMIPRFGFVAAAYTTLISNVVLIMMHYRGYRCCQEVPVYNDKQVLMVSIMCIVACEACILLYMNTVVRYGMILVLMLLTIWKRNLIIDRIKDLRRK